MEKSSNVSVFVSSLSFELFFLRVKYSCCLFFISAQHRIAINLRKFFFCLCVCVNLQRSIVPMEDEDDLELLRLAALKSIHNKAKESVVPPPSTQPPTNGIVADRPPILPLPIPSADTFHGNNIRPITVGPSNVKPPYRDVAGFTNIDSTERFTDFYASNIEPANVQLSPRSAAFVEANKQIIKRRQEHSPSRQSNRRPSWSRSPSQDKWKYHRSTSRSPISPHYRGGRSGTRSPMRRRYSQGRKTRSRSPAQRHDRLDRRSPLPHSNRRNHSPPRNVRRPSSPYHNNNAPSPPRADETNKRGRMNRARSPHQDVRKRSTSRSPPRKFGRGPNTTARRGRKPSPPKRFQRGPNNGRVRNNKFGRRSNSPAHGRRSMSKSPSAPSNPKRHTSPQTDKMAMARRKSAETNRLDEDRTKEETTTESREDNNGHERTSANSAATSNTNGNENSEEQLEKELLASDAENSDSDDDDDDSDGIDLFASEESESENEGRFKSSSTTERKPNVPTVSFSELGKTKTANVLRDLDELQTDTLESGRRRGGGGGRRNDGGRIGRNSGGGGGGARRYNNRKFSDRNCDRDRERKSREKDRERQKDKEREKDVRDREREREREDKDRSKDSSKRSNTDARKHESDFDRSEEKTERKTTTSKSTTKSVESHRSKSSELGE